MIAPEIAERKHSVLPEELGRPLSQKEMYELLEARKESLVIYEWFLNYSRAREIFEGLRSENGLNGAEILENIEQPDASEIRLELRWPVKSDVVSGEHPFGDRARKAKSHPSTYNYVTINFNRVQKRWTPDYGSEPAWTASIEGERVEDVFWVAGSLQSWQVEEAIRKAFSNPKTKGIQVSPESFQGERE
jgi:hypothetical protein